MRLTAHLLSAAALLAVVAHVRAEEEADDHPPPPTDQELKKMKVRELKKWLSDRGLECSNCIEKGDFIKLAKQNREKKILPSKRPRKISKEPMDKQWKKVTMELCTEVGLDEAGCKPAWKAVMGSFDQHARQVGNKLHADKHVMVRTSLSEPYILAMQKQLRAVLSWVKADGITKQEPIKKKVDEKIKKFLTAVAVKNVNPMYEVLEGHDEL